MTLFTMCTKKKVAINMRNLAVSEVSGCSYYNSNVNATIKTYAVTTWKDPEISHFFTKIILDIH